MKSTPDTESQTGHFENHLDTSTIDFDIIPYHKGQTTRQLFYNMVFPEPNTGCWLWAGAVRGGSVKYGTITIGRKSYTATRISYTMHKSNPGKYVVCHSCDNPFCVNPDHLFLGTQKQNVDDCISKNRRKYSRGVNQPNSKLTNDDVIKIRKMCLEGHSQRSTAKQFNVSQAIIYRIGKGKIWSHV